MKNNELLDRPFEQIVIEDFNGSITSALKNGYNQTVAHIFSGNDLPHCKERELQKVSDELDQDRETLFPRRMYGQKMYESLYECPGYKVLKNKFSLTSRGKRRKNDLWNLLKEKGCTKTESALFINILMNNVPVKRNVKFMFRICRLLDVTLEQMIPWQEYGKENFDEFRVPFNYQSQYIDDNQEAQCKIEHATSSICGESIIEEKINILDELLEKLSAKDRDLIEKRFGLVDGNPKKLMEIAEEKGITKQAVLQNENRVLRILRRFAESYAEDIAKIGALEPQNDRVRI